MIEQHWNLISEWFPVAFPVWLFMVGASLGSFMNVVVYRLPIMAREKQAGVVKTSLSYPPSTCPSCGHGIRFWENVPVFGWLVLRGKCSSCAQKISPRYPFVELLSGMSFAIPFFACKMFVAWLSCSLAFFFVVSSLAWITANGLGKRE